MPNVLLGVTGSVAAIYTSELLRSLREAGFAVTIVATRAACYFFDAAAVEPIAGKRNPKLVVLDEDEWPGQDQGGRYQRSDRVLHIELRRWADILLIAPLDANTLAKLAYGLADNCLTCVARAWDRQRPIVLAPAMNTLMWEHPATARHLRLLAEDYQADAVPANPDPASVVDWINSHCTHQRVVPPQSKRLACDDIGMGAMASLPDIVTAVAFTLRQSKTESSA